MNSGHIGTNAIFNAKSTWITLWAAGLASLIVSLRALSLIKPKTCIAFCVIAFIFSILGTLTGLYASKTKLFTDESFIYCKSLLGNEKHLPFDSVTGIKTGHFGTVCITSASFNIKCRFVANKSEFVASIKEKL